MSFILKTVIGLAVMAGGSVLLVNNVPSLKANIMEAINPRVQEQKLIDQLKSNLQAINASLQTQLDGPNITIDKVKSSQVQKLIEESKDILGEIDLVNDEHSGIVDGIISKATDLIIGSGASPSPSPSATATSSGSSQSNSQTTVVTVTVTVTPPPTPCE